MGIPEEKIIEHLTRNGIALDQWSVTENGLAVYTDQKGKLMARVTEDDNLSSAIAAFLRSRGQVVELKPKG